MKNKNDQRQARKLLEELTLLDRFLFDTAMSDPEISRDILSIIFNERNIQPVRIGMAEKTLEPYYDSRAVWLDLLAFDENDVVYDAEAQKENKGKRFLLRRSRLYQSHIDGNLMEPGDRDFGKMNDVYVIFIAPFDLFGENKYMYTFRMTCDEIPGMAMDDGAVRIFLNTRGENEDEVPAPLVEFFYYADNPVRYGKSIEDLCVRKLAAKIEMLKSDQEVSVKYMRLWEELDDARLEGREEGYEVGMTEGIRFSIQNLMTRTGWSAEKAMDVLGIPKDEQEKYLNISEK